MLSAEAAMFVLLIELWCNSPSDMTVTKCKVRIASKQVIRKEAETGRRVRSRSFVLVKKVILPTHNVEHLRTAPSWLLFVVFSQGAFHEASPPYTALSLSLSLSTRHSVITRLIVGVMPWSVDAGGGCSSWWIWHRRWVTDDVTLSTYDTTNARDWRRWSWLCQSCHSTTVLFTVASLYVLVVEPTDRLKWRHSNLWSRYDLHVVGHDVVRWLWEVNWWRVVFICLYLGLFIYLLNSSKMRNSTLQKWVVKNRTARLSRESTNGCLPSK